MLAVKRRADDVIEDSDAKGETCHQVELMPIRRDGLNSDVNVPSFSQPDGLGGDLLAGLRRACGDD